MQKSSLSCSQCSSPLILVSQTTETIEGSLFPQTTSIYRCSNQECQDEKDRQFEKRQELVKEKEAAAKKRLEQKEKERKEKIAALSTK